METSVISYLANRPGRDLIVAAHQELTREWWESSRQQFDLCISGLVFEEAARGDAEAARRRLEYLDGLIEIAVTDDARRVAEKLLQAGALPITALYDALHIAVCAVNGVDILLTWNCKHIANAVMLGVIEETCLVAGYVAPRVCTPIELGGVS